MKDLSYDLNLTWLSVQFILQCFSRGGGGCQEVSIIELLNHITKTSNLKKQITTFYSNAADLWSDERNPFKHGTYNISSTPSDHPWRKSCRLANTRSKQNICKVVAKKIFGNYFFFKDKYAEIWKGDLSKITYLEDKYKCNMHEWDVYGRPQRQTKEGMKTYRQILFIDWFKTIFFQDMKLVWLC